MKKNIFVTDNKIEVDITRYIERGSVMKDSQKECYVTEIFYMSGEHGELIGNVTVDEWTEILLKMDEYREGIRIKKKQEEDGEMEATIEEFGNYAICFTGNIEKMPKLVIEAMKKGFQLQGGICSDGNGFAQAMYLPPKKQKFGGQINVGAPVKPKPKKK